MSDNDPPTPHAARARTTTSAAAATVAAWHASLTRWVNALLAFALVSGLAIYLLPFSTLPQFTVLVHIVFGLALLAPLTVYVWRHWRQRGGGNLSHYQLVGYVSLALVVLGCISGLVLTAQALWTERIDYVWDFFHLFTGVALGAAVIAHILMLWLRPVPVKQQTDLMPARRRFLRTTLAIPIGLAVAVVVIAAGYDAVYAPTSTSGFAETYSWRFGADRPFAPSLARVDDHGWGEKTVNAVRGALADPQRNQFDEGFASTNHLMGLFERVEVGIEDLSLAPVQRQRIDQALTDAQASLRSNGAVPSQMLAGSAACGSSGCHEQIYEEWLPSAHRYSSMDDMFQTVQHLMVDETSSEHTRYCAGCHDPISLFSGAKDDDNVTLSAAGADEGISCVVCHSMVQADVQGNGDYTLSPAERYSFELSDGAAAKLLSDFLIRVYPTHHVESYSRPLYKSAEFCAACHKQYVDLEVNTDIGRVQGQNQYDSWRNSRWFKADDPAATIQCRECHMPLQASIDPARGDVTDFYRNPDDGMHRSHRTLASNQYIPVLQDLPGAAQHVALTESWLRGEIEIPEIADRWTDGPVVRMALAVPEVAAPGESIPIRVFLTNNKTGHDFPTGPLDMIESWVEVVVTDAAGEIVFHAGQLDDDGRVDQSPVVFRADGYDREGMLIDRHNLWDLVGVGYKRTLYPGVNDTVVLNFQCPSLARGRVSPTDERSGAPGKRTDAFEVPVADAVVGPLTVNATLWYRKANPDFLDRVYGHEAAVRAPVTAMTEAMATVVIDDSAQTSP